jgi:hypothetical protein
MTAERGLDQAVYPGTVAEIAEPDHVLLAGHDVPLGRYTVVRRLLPHRQRRMVGAWCFVDHFGPDDVAGRPGMQVPPHPHTGLQTVTWLVDGIIEHRDSLGSHQTIEAGQLNLMTSGHGIAHSEYTSTEHPPIMHGLQLWVALPDDARPGPARFEHHDSMPVQHIDGAAVTVVVGRLGPARSPARVHTPLLGAEIASADAGQHRLPVDPDFEHGMLVMSGAASVAGADLVPGSLLYLGPGRTEIRVAVRVRPGCSCSAACPSTNRWSCGGTSSAARTRRSSPPARTGWRGGASARSPAAPPTRCPHRGCPPCG